MEEDKIAWYSNNSVPFICYTLDLEECEIAGDSNATCSICTYTITLEKSKIAWFSNTCYTFQPEHTWEAEEIAEFSNKDVGGFAL